MIAFIESFLGHQEVDTVFKAFGAYHIFWLIVAIFCMLYFAHRKRNPRVEKYLATIVFVSQLLSMVWYMGGNSFWLDGLPLYTCRIAAISFGFGYWYRSSFLKAFGTYLGFVGGIIALLNPVFYPLQIWHFCNINFFIFHVALLSLSSYYLSHYGDSIRKQQRRVQVAVLRCMLVIAVVNFFVGSNYSFASSAPLFQDFFDRFSWLTYFFALNVAYQSMILAEGKLINSQWINKAADIDWRNIIPSKKK
ncbi:TIGR02206 family membrane protein [Allofustis seminis]|uniref:TMEM164-related integral membrane acyltransferase n=1 Tax=Allofustis seminis TaxID=166939 RepID=UPI00036CFAD5|nr:TIGR02206 family membrane protein [Allofustis seminis]